MTDHDLLQRYARENSQAAFAELVARHLNLVYSAARRQVRAPQLAEDITQSVFLDLAHHARDFPAAQPLAAWLHVVTRRTAIDAIRHESRRLAREHTAADLAATDAMPPSSPSTWSQLEPHLDEAVAALPDADRQAILLRYFENKSLREIGASLGTSDDAAQKRVSRALDHLRTFFLRRGLTVTAASLATDLSAHATLTAPAALSGSIATATSALGAATLPSAATLVAKTALMTTLQKSLATATLVAVGGIALYEVVTISRQRRELAQLESRSTVLTADLARTRAEQTATAQRLANVESQIDARLHLATPPPTGSDPALERQIRTWLAHSSSLKQLAAQRPDLSIPEFQLLNADDWADSASKMVGSLPTDEAGIRRAFASLRYRAERLMSEKLFRALKGYLKTTDGLLPDTLPQLLVHFDPPIDPLLLSRYELLHTGKLNALSAYDRGNAIITSRHVIDMDQDSVWRMGELGLSAHSATVPLSTIQRNASR